MKSKYLLYAVPALMLAACSSEEPAAGGAGTDGAAIVTADIAGIVKSRAHDTAWEAGDQIGISGTSGAVDYINVPYTTAGDGSFTASNGVSKGIFFQNKETVTFSAYYPYNAGVTAENAEIAASTADQSKSKEFDFLFATGATGSVANPAISFTGDAAFSHRMTQLVIKVTPDKNSGFSSFTALSEGTHTLSGLKSDGVFKTATGEAGAIGEAADWILNGNVTPVTEESALTFAMILFPQEVAEGVTYRIEYDGATYSCTLNPALLPGKRYTYNVTLKKTGLTVDSSTITDWDDEPTEDVNAGMDSDESSDPFNGHEAVLMREATADEPALYIATCNLGASTPYETGKFFWWGDVIGHSSDAHFDFSDDNEDIVTALKNLDQLKAEGYIDERGNLTSSYDAARQQLGGDWRLPTVQELNWLIDSSNCTWTWQESPLGAKVRSLTTDGEIFLPAAGFCNNNSWEDFKIGCYWSSSIIIDDDSRWNTPCYLYLKEDNSATADNKISAGLTIRPVVTR